MKNSISKSLMDLKVSNKRYKSEAKAIISEMLSNELIAHYKNGIVDARDKASKELSEFKALPISNDKPQNDDSLSKLERRVLWAPYNNFLRVQRLETYVSLADVILNKMSKKTFRKLYYVLLDKHIDSLRTKAGGSVIIDSIMNPMATALEINPRLMGNVIQLWADAGMFRLTNRTLSEESSGHDWLIDYDFGEVSELAMLKRYTSKDNVVLSEIKEVDNNSFLISQKSWTYEKKYLPEALVDSVNYLQEQRYTFADYVDAEYIYNTVIAELSKRDGIVYDWMKAEAMFYKDECNRIMNNGGSFSIRIFLDGANRMYYKGMFSFHKSEAFKTMLRFAKKYPLGKQGIKEVKHAIVVKYYGLHDTDIEKAVEWFDENQTLVLNEHKDDKWGYINAVMEPRKHTNIILFLDATSQGTQIYGAAGCSAKLLEQAGSFPNGKSSFTKAYALLAEGLNDELSLYYGTNVECFTNDNVKALHMTSLYNSGKNRVLKGQGYSEDRNDGKTFAELFDSLSEVEEEYETNASKLGKLVPLLKTVREAGLNIDEEELYKIFRKVLTEISGEALDTMKIINKLSYGNENVGVFEWTSPDGVNNQYANSKTIQYKIYWVDMNGKQHSKTHHEKVLEPGSRWRGLAPRIIQSIDAYIERLIVLWAKGSSSQIAVVHDSFGVQVNKAKGLREAYKHALKLVVVNDPISLAFIDISGNLKAPSIQSVQAARLGISKDSLVDLIKDGIDKSKWSLMY